MSWEFRTQANQENRNYYSGKRVVLGFVRVRIIYPSVVWWRVESSVRGGLIPLLPSPEAENTASLLKIWLMPSFPTQLEETDPLASIKSSFPPTGSWIEPRVLLHVVPHVANSM